MRADEHVLFERHALEELRAVLDAAAVADLHVGTDVHTLANHAVLADDCAVRDVRERPDRCAVADTDWVEIWRQDDSRVDAPAYPRRAFHPRTASSNAREHSLTCSSVIPYHSGRLMTRSQKRRPCASEPVLIEMPAAPGWSAIDFG